MKKFIKKVSAAVMAFVVTLSMIVLSGMPENNVSAATTSSGTCGNNLTWTFDGSGTLTISGVGVMEDYAANFGSSTAPWSSYNITSVVIENGVTSIGNHAFYDSSNVENVSISDSVKSIGNNAFAGCNLKTITIPEGVEKIQYSAFANCFALQKVIIPSTVSTIGSAAFNGCKSLKEVNIPQKVTKIEDSIFYGCALAKIEIPNGAESIGKGAFCGCKNLLDIAIPNGVKSIGNYAFQDCGLTTIEIPDAVISIGYDAFKNCTNLADASFESNNPPAFGTDIFANTAIVNGNGEIYVPCGSPDAYKTAANMSAYGDYITGRPHSFDTGNWNADNENHWHSCTVCGAKEDEAPHIWSQGKCTECEYETSGIAIDETNFPDANFRNYVSENFDKDSNNSLSAGEIASVTSINVLNKKIADLTGIACFTNLERLSCNNNQLTSLDLRQNTGLGSLSCENNQLTSLDVSQNTELRDLDCGNNQLTSLDVSQNTALEYLYCRNNRLTSLDLRQNTGLKSLDCDNNQLTSLDLRQNTGLESLSCDNNQLTSLDVSQNIALTYLYCGNNQLTSLDVSQNIALTYLYCDGNRYTVSGCLFDPAVLPDSGKSSGWTNAKLTDDGKILYLGGDVNYTYDCGNGKSASFTLRFSGHSCTKVEAKDAACTDDGNIEYYECAVYGYKFKKENPAAEADILSDEDIVTAATGHSYGNWAVTKAPTLTAEGTVQRVCTGNAEHKESKNIPALSDTTVWTKDDSRHVEPTEEADGRDVYTSEYGEVTVTLPKKEAHSHNYADGKCTICGKIDPDHKHIYEDGVCTICGHKSDIIHKVEQGTNAPETAIATPQKELENIVLTGDDIDNAANGTNIEILLKIDNADASVSKTDKEAIDSRLSGTPELKDFEVGQYLDINLFKIVGENRSKISETKAKVKICITVPDSLKDSSNTGEFAVLRVHNGVAEVLNDMDDNPDTVTIETDRFSTYAIVYKNSDANKPDDKPNTDKPDDGNTGDDDGSDAKDEPENTEAPDASSGQASTAPSIPAQGGTDITGGSNGAASEGTQGGAVSEGTSAANGGADTPHTKDGAVPEVFAVMSALSAAVFLMLCMRERRRRMNKEVL